MTGSAAMFPQASGSGSRLRVFGDDGLARLFVAGGSERAFATLYERHHRALYRYCRSIVRDEHDAQDVLQTTMARAFASLRKGPPDAPLRAWLFRIAHNEAISLLRARRPTAQLDEADHFAGSSVEGSVEERMRLALLVADLGHLPERQRSALVMRELSGLSHAEIACALGVSLSGAKQAICEARVGLQEFAKGREMGCAEIQRLISDADGRRLRGRAVRAHLRSCGDCRALGDAIEQRRCDLAALAPALPAATATGLLARLFGVVGHANGGGATATAAATTGKAASGALAGKLAAGAVVLATVVVGAPNIVEQLSKHSAAGANHSTPAVRRAAVGAPAPRPAAPGRATSAHGVRTSSRNSAADGHRRSARESHSSAASPPATRPDSSNGRGATPPGSPQSDRPNADTPRTVEPGAVTTDSPDQAVDHKAVDVGSSCCAPSADGNPSTSPPVADGNPRSTDERTTPGSNASAHARPAPDTTPKLGRETEPAAPSSPTSTATPSSISPGDTAPTTPPAGNPTTPPTDNRSASGTRATPDRPLTNQGG